MVGIRPLTRRRGPGDGIYPAIFHMHRVLQVHEPGRLRQVDGTQSIGMLAHQLIRSHLQGVDDVSVDSVHLHGPQEASNRYLALMAHDVGEDARRAHTSGHPLGEFFAGRTIPLPDEIRAHI